MEKFQPVKDIQAIVMDMDGTLLDSENKITPLTKEVLMDLENQGTELILASGRSYTRLMPYAKELEMNKHKGQLLEVDGIAVYDLDTMERNVLHRMDTKDIQEVFDYLISQPCEAMACFDDGLYDHIPAFLIPIKKKLREEMHVDEDFPWTAGPWGWLQDLRKGYPKITYINKADEIKGKINKIQIMVEEDKIQPLFEDLKAKFGNEFEIFRTTPRQLEILPKGFSKGQTLKKIIAERGWDPNKVLVFGDGENDVSMFEAVPNSFAMDNAKDYVKDKSRYIAGDHDKDGIVQALIQEGFIKGKE